MPTIIDTFLTQEIEFGNVDHASLSFRKKNLDIGKMLINDILYNNKQLLVEMIMLLAKYNMIQCNNNYYNCGV